MVESQPVGSPVASQRIEAAVGATPDVFVAATDPVGFAVALAVAEQGATSVVLDGADDIPRQRTGALLSAESTAILDRLTDGAVSAAGVAIHTTRLLPRGAAVTDPRAAGRERTSEPPLLGIDPDMLLSVLRSRVDAAPGCVRVSGGFVSAIANTRGTSGPLRLTRTLAPGSAAAAVPALDETFEATYVVGADGPDSPVREVVGLPFDGRERRDTVLTVEVDTTLALRPDGPVERRIVIDPPGGGRALDMLPIGAARWRLTWIFGGGSDRGVELEPRALAERIERTLGANQPYTLVGADLTVVRCRLAPRFADGRVFLAGSAAHQCSPLGARTLNLGIAEADNLGWKLAYARRGIGGGPLLGSYDAERRPVADDVVAADRAHLDFLAPTDRWSRLRRRLAAGAPDGLGDVPPVATYRSSPVVQPGAGAFAPELPVVPLGGGTAVPLRTLRGGSVVAIAVGATVAEAQALAAPVASALPADGPPVRFVAAAAADATADHDTAGAALGNFLIVRPDGRFIWKVNGEDEPRAVAKRLVRVLRDAVGRT